MALPRKPPGRCIFCGNLGLTKEHMWADWLRSYIPRTMTEHRTRSVVVGLNEDNETFTRRTGDPHSRRIRCVCRSCNNGWMGKLQEQVKPFLVPMLTGTSTSLNRRAQTVLATWIAMTVMVAEQIDPTKAAISETERNWFRLNQRAPSRWRIWIGRQLRNQAGMFTHNSLTFGTEEEVKRIGRYSVDRPANTQTSTICLGQHLLVHVMNSDVAWSIIRRWNLPPELSPSLTQIWPIRASLVSWPLNTALNDAGIEFLANEFMHKAQSLIRDLAHSGRL